MCPIDSKKAIIIMNASKGGMSSDCDSTRVGDEEQNLTRIEATSSTDDRHETGSTLSKDNIETIAMQSGTEDVAVSQYDVVPQSPPSDEGNTNPETSFLVPEICISPPEEESCSDVSLDSSLLDSSLNDSSCSCEQHCYSPSGVAQLVVPSFITPNDRDSRVCTLKPWQCSRNREQRRANAKRMKLVQKCDPRFDPMV